MAGIVIATGSFREQTCLYSYNWTSVSVIMAD